jgi:hypothetical protein
MRGVIFSGLLGMSALLTATPAMADPTADDLNCFVVSLQAMQSQDVTVRASGWAGQLYFLGKLNGRTPTLDLENRVLAEVPKMIGATLQAETKRCGAEMTARGRFEAAMGQDMMGQDITNRGLRAPQKANPR